MARKKLISTNELAKLYDTSHDQIIRWLRKAGVKPHRETKLAGRTFRDWDREYAITKVNEFLEDRNASRVKNAADAAGLREVAAATISDLSATTTVVDEATTKMLELLHVQGGALMAVMEQQRSLLSKLDTVDAQVADTLAKLNGMRQSLSELSKAMTE